MQTMLTFAIARTNTAIAGDKVQRLCLYLYLHLYLYLYLYLCLYFSMQAAVQLAEHKAGAKAELRRETASFAATQNEGKTH